MENIKETIEQDFKQAFKGKQVEIVDVLKMVKTAIKNEEIAAKTDKLPDEKINEVIQREVKKRRESVEAFTKAGRTELADKEKKEIDILAKYLPKQADDAEIEKILRAKAIAVGAKTPADTGKLMGAAMKELKGKADGSKVKSIAAKILSGN